MKKSTKAKINKIVKKIKAARAESKAQEQVKTTAGFPYQVSSAAEKGMIGLGLAAGMAILLDDSRKRRKAPKKARCFPKRVADNYKFVSGLLDSTVAEQLKIDSEREFKDEALEKLKIEDAVKFDL